jgi:hypothetical protein
MRASVATKVDLTAVAVMWADGLLSLNVPTQGKGLLE